MDDYLTPHDGTGSSNIVSILLKEVSLVMIVIILLVMAVATAVLALQTLMMRWGLEMDHHRIQGRQISQNHSFLRC